MLNEVKKLEKFRSAEEMLRNAKKGVYSKVAEKYGVSFSCIERDIRHSIEATFLDRSFLEINQMFKLNIFTIDDKPTAGEFIQLIAEYYHLGLYSRELAFQNTVAVQ